MKNLFLPLSAFAFLLTSCGAQNNLSDGKTIDRKLLGVWTGSESNEQIDGVTKKWEMNRMKDGNYSIHFTFTNDGETDKTTETGKWWTDNGRYYELHSYDDKTDIYTYEVLNDKQVKFKTETISIDMENNNYEFIDTKIGESKSEKNSARDGSSIKKAIKVNSVPEEYQYVRKNCIGCEMKSQALTEENGKYYDILTLKDSSGKEVRYYFDITSFYGKGF